MFEMFECKKVFGPVNFFSVVLWLCSATGASNGHKTPKVPEHLSNIRTIEHWAFQIQNILGYQRVILFELFLAFSNKRPYFSNKAMGLTGSKKVDTLPERIKRKNAQNPQTQYK